MSDPYRRQHHGDEKKVHHGDLRITESNAAAMANLSEVTGDRYWGRTDQSRIRYVSADRVRPQVARA